MTEAAEPAPAAAPTPAARAARQLPAELTYRLDRELVERRASREPDWLADDRRRALAAFDALPVEPNLLYTPYVDLRAAALSDVRAPERGDAGPVTASDDPGEGLAALAVFDEQRVVSLALSRAARQAGVTVEPPGALLERDASLARRLLGAPGSLPAEDKLAQLSLAAWGQGVVVRVPPGVVLDAPVVLRWTVGTPGVALHARTIVELGNGAEASLVEELVASPAARPGAQALFTNTTEVRLGAHARLAMASLQELGPDQIVFQQRLAEIGEGAELRWALAQLGGRLVRSRVDNVLAGDRSTVEQVEIVFGSGDQLHDLTSYTRHVGRDTTGELLSKGALLDRSRSYMKGMITIEKTAIGTDSYLGEFGMNLSRRARAVAIPSLEIDQPDCRRAAHSSSVGPIDENQLFYLESRGIPPDEARKFIVLGFLEPVVARVPLDDARGRLRDALEAKWAAGLAAQGAGSSAA
jgi:Fe-S cluster assembly scaffold protein SufB